MNLHYNVKCESLIQSKFEFYFWNSNFTFREFSFDLHWIVKIKFKRAAHSHVEHKETIRDCAG